MQTESDLYRQSEQEITPIVDYIPIPDTLQLPESSRWRMKQQLDESRERPHILHPSLESMQPFSSLRIQSRLNTESAVNECDKKTTSIMQGHSANTIPSNELSINVIKDNLKSCMTYRQRYEDRNNRSNQQSYQNFGRNTEGQPWRSRSKESEVSLHFMNQRSKLLRNIDRSLDEQRMSYEEQRFEFRECKKQRKKLLNQILEKLETSMKQKKEVELVKSNCKETEVSSNGNQTSKERQNGFSKKTKKWVETKNALKSAVMESTQRCPSSSKVIEEHQIIRNHVSEWKPTPVQTNFESPTLIPHPDISQLPIPASTSSSSFYTAHKDFPSRRDEEIFTFNNLQGMPFQKHIKNVSITVSENSSKEFIAIGGQPLAGECLLCKVIGKRCSFH